VRRLVSDRVALLRLLSSAGWGAVALLALTMVVVTLLPAATAGASGWLVARVAEVAVDRAGIGPVVVPLLLVSGLLVADLVAGVMLVPFRDWVASRVNGAIRRTIRRGVGRPARVDHLDDPAVLDAASVPVYDEYLWNMGAAAEGQLWLLARFVGAGASAALIAVFSVPLALFTLVCVLVQRAILRRQYALSVEGWRGRIDTATRASNYWRKIAASPRGAKEIRLFGFGGWVVDEFATHQALRGEQARDLYSKALPRAWVVFVLATISGGVPFVVLVRAGLDDRVSIATLAVALGGVLGLFNMATMGYEAFSIEAAVPRLESLALLDRLAAAAEAEPRTTRRTATTVVPRIEFDGVWFRYPGTSVDVLRGLDLVLLPGQRVAVVGANGVGKSTMLRLLAGFYAPTAGRILVDGEDLTELDAAAWRQRLAMISQDFVHYEFSARDNIALADLDHPDADRLAAEAADAAGAADALAALPAGLGTVLSRGFEDGRELSGGQWQRVALARALYAAAVGAQVLVLDEPTANLDVHAETALFDQLLMHAEGRTSVVISHRFSTVRRAERIVVLADGAVAEDGDHAALLARGGRYAEMYRLQADRYQPTSEPS
jgi:ATP-binding cassette, subfamily B, bacterial